MSFSHRHPHVTVLLLLPEIHIVLSEVQEKSHLPVEFRLEHRSGETYPRKVHVNGLANGYLALQWPFAQVYSLPRPTKTWSNLPK